MELMPTTDLVQSTPNLLVRWTLIPRKAQLRFRPWPSEDFVFAARGPAKLDSILIGKSAAVKPAEFDLNFSKVCRSNAKSQPSTEGGGLDSLVSLFQPFKYFLVNFFGRFELQVSEFFRVRPESFVNRLFKFPFINLNFCHDL